MTNEEGGKRRKLGSADVRALGDERPGDEVLDDLTPEERLELVAELSARMWELTGRPLPDYSRSEMPVRVVRRE